MHGAAWGDGEDGRDPGSSWHSKTLRGDGVAALSILTKGTHFVSRGENEDVTEQQGPGYPRAMGLGPRERLASHSGETPGGLKGSVAGNVQTSAAGAAAKKILKEQCLLAEPFGGLLSWQAALICGVGVVHVGDVVTFCLHTFH